MKPIFLLLAFSCTTAFGQITVDGSAGQNQVANNAPAVIVDPALTVTTSLTIPQFTVKITGFVSGDILAVQGSLPSGITSSYNSTTGQLAVTGNGTAAQYQAILRSVTFRTTSSATTSRTILFQAGDGLVQVYDGHYYRIINGSYTYATAKTAAAALSLFGWQGYLPTIMSTDENSFVFNTIGRGWLGASDEFSEVNAALGTNTFANQAASENRWYWVTGPEKGTQFSTGSTVISGRFAAWNGGEPNNSNGEHFAENVYPNNGSWNDAQGTNLNNALVEFYTPGTTVDIMHTRTIVMVATQLNIAAPIVPYQLQDAAVTVDPALTGYSVSTFTAARVTVSSGFKSGDALTFGGTLPSGLTGSYNSTTGVLTFSSSSAVSIADWQALFRTVKFSSSSNVVGNRTVTFSLGNQVAFSNGHFYEYVGTAATWDNAKTISEGRTYLGLQGYLVTITSADENEFIRQKLSADAWTGASDNFSYINSALGTTTYAAQTNSEGKWYWVTGPERGLQMTTANATAGNLPPVFGTTYNNWNLGEPNNSSSNEHAGSIYSGGTNPGKWNDLNGASTLGYVVEYGGMASDPLLQLTASRVIGINQVLPVHDLRFDIAGKSGNVELDWSTSAEENTKSFAVLHSTDGVSYEVLGNVKAAGNSSVTSSYNWVHQQPGSGIHYYKLAQSDIDGKVIYSEVRKISLTAGEFLLYPTISSASINVKLPASKGSIVILNASGVAVRNHVLSASVTSIQVSGLPAGVYFAELSASGHHQVFRFIKK